MKTHSISTDTAEKLLGVMELWKEYHDSRGEEDQGACYSHCWGMLLDVVESENAEQLNKVFSRFQAEMEESFGDGCNEDE